MFASWHGWGWTRRSLVVVYWFASFWWSRSILPRTTASSTFFFFKFRFSFSKFLFLKTIDSGKTFVLPESSPISIPSLLQIHGMLDYSRDTLNLKNSLPRIWHQTQFIVWGIGTLAAAQTRLPASLLVLAGYCWCGADTSISFITFCDVKLSLQISTTNNSSNYTYSIQSIKLH